MYPTIRKNYPRLEIEIASINSATPVCMMKRCYWHVDYRAIHWNPAKHPDILYHIDDLERILQLSY